MGSPDRQLEYLEAKVVALAAAIEDLECVVSTAKEQAALTLLIETRAAMLRVLANAARPDITH